MMANLCARALIAGIEVTYAQNIIRTHKLVLQSPPYHIENWPWQLKIYTFGMFQIIKEGKPLQFPGKAQKMPLELLMVLISYGGTEVSIEKIMDALWYETDGDMARSAFSTTLNRLRNLIGIKEAIQLRAGKVTVDKNYCWVDIWAFVRALDEAETLWEKGEKQQAIVLYEKAVTLYKGHFFAGESEEPWMIPLRERLKNKFLDAILKLGECWEQEKAFENAIACYEKGLAIDNLEEIFYQRLMTCFDNLGHHAEVIKVYKQCKDVLNEFLGIRPSYETEVIYKKILKGDVVSYNE